MYDKSVCNLFALLDSYLEFQDKPNQDLYMIIKDLYKDIDDKIASFFKEPSPIKYNTDNKNIKKLSK